MSDLQVTCDRLSARLIELQGQMPEIADLQGENKRLLKLISKANIACHGGETTAVISAILKQAWKEKPDDKDAS